MYDWGVVSNVFNSYTKSTAPESNKSLGDMVLSAKQSSGLRYVELRQFALGGAPFETDDAFALPNATAFMQLASANPDVKFSYAFQMPLFSLEGASGIPWAGVVNVLASPVFEAALAAGVALAKSQKRGLMLRVVDVTTKTIQSPGVDSSAFATAVAALVNMTSAVVEADELDGVLLIENAMVPWAVFSDALAKATAIVTQRYPKLSGAAFPLQLCYDPANLAAFSGDLNITLDVTKFLASEPSPLKMGMLHVKQSVGGKIQDKLQPLGGPDAGIDWQAHARFLAGQAVYPRGPILFEFSPSLEVLGSLQEGKQTLKGLGFDVIPPTLPWLMT